MSERIRNSGVYQRLTSSTNELERLFREVDEKKSTPDIKKVLLLMGLGTLSWISTYSGLLELIKANSGDIAFTYKLAIGFAVAMLMLMIVYILDQLFAPLNWLLRTIYIFGYIFLTLISVGFGFGFYWKFLESRSEATRSAESAVTQVQSALQGGQTRLEQLEQTLTSLTALSVLKAREEREKGNSCPNSRPGDGPRRRMRDQDAKNFSFAGDFITKRAQSVADDIKLLNADMVKIASRHPSTVDPKTGTRNAFMKNLSQRLDLTITRFNAFRTDPQLQGIRNNLAERATTTRFPLDGGGTFPCPDPQLQGALRGVVAAIDQLPLLKKPVINAVEGSEATIEAFRRLGATLGGLMVLKLPPSEDELRELRKKAVRSMDQKQKGPVLTAFHPGLNERDYIPLAIAIFVDFCLLLVSINRPMDRLKSLVPVMKDARDGPISGILSSFHATHFAGIREEFSLFQHVVFDWGGHYYVAVPLASNDIQAQYLANLFVSLEGRGIVDRAMIPPGFIIRSKLKKMGSSFAEHRAFRLYKFRNGAWSNIVMDAVMGAAKDVSIAIAAEQKTEQLENSITDPRAQDAQHKGAKSANFASLFKNQVKTVNGFDQNGNDQPDHNEFTIALTNGKESPAVNGKDFLEPELEMPRLFQTEKQKSRSRLNGQDEQNVQSTRDSHENQNEGHNETPDNIIKPSRFTRSPKAKIFEPLKSTAPEPETQYNDLADGKVNGAHPVPDQDPKLTTTIADTPFTAIPEDNNNPEIRPRDENGHPLSQRPALKSEKITNPTNIAKASKDQPKTKNPDKPQDLPKSPLGKSRTLDDILNAAKQNSRPEFKSQKRDLQNGDKAKPDNHNAEKSGLELEKMEKPEAAKKSAKPALSATEINQPPLAPEEKITSKHNTPPPLNTVFPYEEKKPENPFERPSDANSNKKSEIAVGKITKWFAENNNQQDTKNSLAKTDGHNPTKETT